MIMKIMKTKIATENLDLNLETAATQKRVESVPLRATTNNHNTTMKTLKAIILLVLLAAVSPLLLQAQTTESFTFITNRLVPDGNFSGLNDVRSVTTAVGNISSLNVRLKVAGEYNGDLYVYLRHTNGFVVLLNRVGKTATDDFGYGDSGFDVTFATGAANGDIHVYQTVTNLAAGSPLLGLWQPDGRNVDPATVTDLSPRTTSLTNFNGLNGAGEWTLYLADASSGGSNQLVQWSLDISGAATPTLTWTNPADITYGTALSAQQLNAAATYSSTNVPGTFTYAPPAGTVLNAGSNQTVTVTFAPTDTSSFLPVTNSIAINVATAPLNITANDTNTIYGAALPGFTATYTGFVNGDTTNNLTTPELLTTTATAASGTGAYVITAAGATSPNYTITHHNGTLTIAPAALVVTAQNQSKLYGAALPALTASYAGFVNGDTNSNLTAQPILVTTATASSPTGVYPITASSATSTNYNISYAPGTLTISTAPLVITANDQSKLYGAALPTLTASYTGFVNGDTNTSLTAQPNLVTTATASSPTGVYPITAASATSTNYSISYAGGTLTVSTAPLVITANDQSKLYGAALPTLTASYTGFVNGDTNTSLTVQPNLVTTATADSSPTGTYPITANSAASTNYSISYTAGTLTIAPATITVTADDKVKTYGAALPVLTASYSGFVLSQGTNDLTGLASLVTTATASSPFGTYSITASGATSTNYAFSYVGGTLTVTQSLSSGVVISSANPQIPGSNVTFTATISAVAPGAGTPTGPVNFRIDGGILGSGVLSGGVATFTTNSLALGTHTVAAEYAGDVNFIGTTNSLPQVQVINTPPVAGNDTIVRSPTTSVKVLLSTLLANDSDADGDTLTPTVSTTSANGASIRVSGGWVFYTPPAGFTNADSFTYTITDGRGGSAQATVTVAILVDNAPSQNLVITSLGGNQYRIDGSGIPGRTYRLQSSDTASPFTWQDLSGGSLTADGVGRFQYTDTTTATMRFYRSVYP